MDRRGMAVTTPEIATGQLWWAELDPTLGREQAGRRPVVIVSTRTFHDLADTLAIVVPVTITDRGWRNQVKLSTSPDLGQTSIAMPEQVRTISRARLVRHVGEVDETSLSEIRTWLAAYLVPDPETEALVDFT